MNNQRWSEYAKLFIDGEATVPAELHTAFLHHVTLAVIFGGLGEMVKEMATHGHTFKVYKDTLDHQIEANGTAVVFEYTIRIRVRKQFSSRDDHGFEAAFPTTMNEVPAVAERTALEIMKLLFPNAQKLYAPSGSGNPNMQR